MLPPPAAGPHGAPHWQLATAISAARAVGTCDVVAVVDAAVDGAEGAAGDDALDDELGGVDLPVLPPGAERVLPPAAAALVGAGGGLLLALLHGPGAAEVALQLLVQALEVDLVRAHEPRVPARAGGLPHAWWELRSRERAVEARGGCGRRNAVGGRAARPEVLTWFGCRRGWWWRRAATGEGEEVARRRWFEFVRESPCELTGQRVAEVATGYGKATAPPGLVLRAPPGAITRQAIRRFRLCIFGLTSSRADPGASDPTLQFASVQPLR